MVQSIETENVLLDGGAMYSCHAGFDKWNQQVLLGLLLAGFPSSMSGNLFCQI